MDTQITRDPLESEELEDLLKSHKYEIFCPDTWELYELAEGGREPADRLANHLTFCDLCSEELQRLRSKNEQRVPGTLFAEFRKHCRADAQPAPTKLGERALQWLESLKAAFKFPVMAAATTAALVIVMILILPHGEMRTVLATSSVEWNSNSALVPKAKPFAPDKTKVAMVIYVKSAKDVPQEKIDALYKSLNPKPELKSKYDFVAPSRLKDETASNMNSQDLIKKMNKDLGVDRLVLITITSQKSGFAIQDELIDAANGNRLAKAEKEAVQEKDLETQLPELTMPLLGNAPAK